MPHPKSTVERLPPPPSPPPPPLPVSQKCLLMRSESLTTIDSQLEDGRSKTGVLDQALAVPRKVLLTRDQVFRHRVATYAVFNVYTILLVFITLCIRLNSGFGRDDSFLLDLIIISTTSWFLGITVTLGAKLWLPKPRHHIWWRVQDIAQHIVQYLVVVGAVYLGIISNES